MSISYELSDSAENSEETINTLTHGIGFLLSVATAVAMSLTHRFDGWSEALACWVFAATMMAVYGASTLSHAFQRPDLKHTWRCWDQGCIYLLIAGTYTPYAVAYLPAAWQTPFFLGLWGTALAGFVSKVFCQHQVNAVSTVIYLLLGWVPAFVFYPVAGLIPPVVLAWTFAAGVAYSVGTVFLNLDQRVSYFHAVWHLLVIAGSGCHTVAIGLALAG